jgi:hypothetical protein
VRGPEGAVQFHTGDVTDVTSLVRAHVSPPHIDEQDEVGLLWNDRYARGTVVPKGSHCAETSAESIT